MYDLIPKGNRYCYRRENIPEDGVILPYILSLCEENNQEVLDGTTAHQQ
jgi:hypothetical protein